MKSRILLPLILLAIAPAALAGPDDSAESFLSDAARILYRRPPPSPDELRQLEDEAAAWSRDDLSDDAWLDFHLLILELRRRLEPAATAPALQHPSPPPVPTLADLGGRVTAARLLDLAAAVPTLTPVVGVRQNPVQLTKVYQAAATRAADLAESAEALAGGASDELVRIVAEVLAERARDLAFDLRMVAETRVPCGRNRFVRLLADRHRLSVTPEETVWIGEEEFRRTIALMDAVAKSVGPDATWQGLTEKYRADSAKSEAELHTLCLEITREAEKVAAVSGLITIPDAAVKPRVRMVRAGFPAPYAHYRPGKLDKQGRFTGFAAYTPIPKEIPDAERRTRLRERDRHFLRAVCPHEAVPGHHLQFAVAAGMKRPLRRLGYNSSYVEGWGLYSEALMERLGFFEAPGDRLAFHRMRLWRAARVIIDVGLHTGELRPSEAVRILTDEVLLSRSAAEAEVSRYLRSPTQPLSYLLGMRRIQAIRRGYLAIHGEGSEREFHDRFLALSPVPLDLAAAVLLNRRDAYDRAHP